jgi:adenylate cyclase
MLRFQTLGGLTLRADDGRELLSVLTQPKRVALLAYLALSPDGAFRRRDILISYFWPESDAERARSALRQAIHYLRRSLGEGVILGRGDEEVGLDPSRFSCDAIQFESLLVEGRRVEALELYRGELLEGFHAGDLPEWERWLERVRNRLREKAYRAAMVLADEQEEAGDFRIAAQWARHALVLGGDQELPLQRLIALLDQSGDRCGAVRAYDDFARRAADELGVDLAPETRALIREVRSRNASVLAPSDIQPVPLELPLSTAPAPVAAEHSAPEESLPRGRSSQRMRWPLAISGTALAAVVLLGFSLGKGGIHASPQPDPQAIFGAIEKSASIAVLPFADHSAERDQAYLADGIAEEIIDALTRTGDLRVVARTSAFSFRHQDLDVRDIGRKLGVEYVLEGSLDRFGDRIKIRVRLVSVADGSNLWSETYERGAADIFALQEGIAGSVAVRLSSRIAGNLGAASPSAQVPDPEAYDLYLRAIHFQDLSYSIDGAMKSIDFFRRSLAIDPNFAPAHAGLAFATIQLPNVGAISAGDAFREARLQANRALEIDPSSAEGHATLALIHYHDQQFSASETGFRKALSIAPDHPRTLYWYSLYLVAMGQDEIGLATMKRALDRDPLSLRVHTGIGLVYYYQRNYQAAIAQLGRTVELNPNYPFSHWVLGLVYIQTGDHARATQHLSNATTLSGGSPLIKATLGSAYARAGQRQAAAKILEEIRSPANGLYLRPQGLVYLLSDLGRREEALDVLETSVRDRSIHPHVLRAEPLLDPLRDSSRFQALSSRLGPS